MREVEVTGCVFAVNVQRKTLQLQTDQGEKVLVPFTEEDEVDVITALKGRNSVQLLVKGQGHFSPDGKLREVQNVTAMLTVANKNREVDPNAPSIEEKIMEICSDVPDEAWEDMPTDFSHRHDFYLYGYDKHKK